MSKCLVTGCRVPEHEFMVKTTAHRPIPLCAGHAKRYDKAYKKRFGEASHFGAEGRFASWVATWLQNVGLELQNEQTLPPAPVKSSYPQYESQHIPLPEHATKAGQAAIAQRNKEQAALEAQLDRDVADYRKGRRMELELELRTKREAAALEAKKT